MIRRSGLRGNWSDHDIGAQRFQVTRFLNRSFVGHHKDALVTLYRRDDRQPDASIAGSRFDDCAAGFQNACAFRCLNHRHADAILH